MTGELILFGVLGLATGSFLTLVVERLESVESFLVGRSHCNHCKKVLRWWELLPFIGYFIVRGKCVRCNKKIPRVYPFFELITGLTFIGLRFAYGPIINYPIFILELIFVSSLLLLFFYDALYQLFPASLLMLSAVLLIVLLIARLTVPHLALTVIDQIRPNQYLLGMLVGGAALGILSLPSRGKWMGYGDVIVSAIIGLWVGFPLIIVSLLVAFYSGAIVGGGLLLTHKLAKDHRIAFGPFLILGGIVTRIWGDKLFYLVLRVWGLA